MSSTLVLINVKLQGAMNDVPSTGAFPFFFFIYIQINKLYCVYTKL